MFFVSTFYLIEKLLSYILTKNCQNWYQNRRRKDRINGNVIQRKLYEDQIDIDTPYQTENFNQTCYLNRGKFILSYFLILRNNNLQNTAPKVL